MSTPRSACLAVVALTLGAAACSGENGEEPVVDQRRDAAYDAAITAGLDEEVAEFLGLAALGATATYRATITGMDDADEVVVTSRPPDLRVDIVAEGRTIAILVEVDGEALVCSAESVENADEPELVCADASVTPKAPGALDDRTMAELTESLAQRVDDYDFAVRTEVIAGIDATCLYTTLRPGRARPDLGEAGTMCVSPEGAMLRIERDGTSIEATTYTTDVGDDAFVVDR